MSTSEYQIERDILIEAPVEVVWRSYQLDPTLPEHYDGTELEYLSSRKGMPSRQVAQMFERADQARVAANGPAQMQLAVRVRKGFGEVELPHGAEPGQQ